MYITYNCYHCGTSYSEEDSALKCEDICSRYEGYEDTLFESAMNCMRRLYRTEYFINIHEISKSILSDYKYLNEHSIRTCNQKVKYDIRPIVKHNKLFKKCLSLELDFYKESIKIDKISELLILIDYLDYLYENIDKEKTYEDKLINDLHEVRRVFYYKYNTNIFDYVDDFIGCCHGQQAFWKCVNNWRTKVYDKKSL